MDSSPHELRISPQLAIPLAELEFQFVRSSGPGGQNVNKVNSQAQLHWNLSANTSLPDDVKQRLQSLQRRRITTEGWLYLSSQRYRDQLRNRQDCLDKLSAMILAAAAPPVERKLTKVPRGAKLARLRDKRQRSTRKSERRRPSADD